MRCRKSLTPVIKALLGVLIFCLSAEATSYGPPERRLVTSPNEKFVLLVNPETEEHIISAASAPGVGLWSFSRTVWHSPFLLSNDGQTVAVVGWRHVKVQELEGADCVTFYRPGMPEKGIPFDEVYPNPPRTMFVGIGPVGDFWRTWYHDVEQNGDLFTIATTGGGSATFDLNKRELTRTSWVGYRKPMNLLAGMCVIVLAMVAFRIRRRRLPKESWQSPSHP